MKIGTVRGIGVYIHWTFWVLIAFYLLPILASEGLAAAAAAGVFIAGVFACVVAHEFGHAGAAAMYGIPTADITLLPIGGVARLTRLPEKPVQELVVALAGPAVNVVIAALLFSLYFFGLAFGNRAPGIGLESDLIVQLIAANVVLFAFNLIPAFPMDGGRVLRGLLAMRTTHLRATQIAARVGRWMALGFVILAFYSGAWTLLLIAGFVFVAGTAELLQAKVREVARTHPTSPWDPSMSGQSGAGPGSPTGQSPFGGQFGGGNPFGASGWYTHVWPERGSYYRDPASGTNAKDSDVIDAVDVREVDSNDEGRFLR